MGNGEEILCAYQEKGVGKLALISEGILTSLDFPFTDYSQVVSGPHFAACLMGSPQKGRKVMKVDTINRTFHQIDSSDALAIGLGFFSKPESIEYPSTNGRKAYGYFYSPKNLDVKGPDNEKPPLLVMIHGGPTAAADPIFNLRIQYWTSRGFAVFDANYAGSSGFGRKYRESLNGMWGVRDVEDCIGGAKFLAAAGKVDGKKMAIRGGSSGGFTTLLALANSSLFAAGASYYGVADLELLLKDTHKFEANYLDTLIGPYPEKKAVYNDRSPVSQIEKIDAAVIFFQGDSDKVVPPNQSITLYEALKKREIFTKLIIYENEEHGFRKAPNIQDSLEQELKFYLEAFKREAKPPS
jgi:dipeptidyl aminopeptidase/acylaminoacyl peptidase